MKKENFLFFIPVKNGSRYKTENACMIPFVGKRKGKNDSGFRRKEKNKKELLLIDQEREAMQELKNERGVF